MEVQLYSFLALALELLVPKEQEAGWHMVDRK